MSKLSFSTEPVLGIIGPSAVGKSTIVRQLALRKLIHVNPTWTTRPRRPDEQIDLEHAFVSQPEFDTLKNSGTFLETVRMFGTPYWYGLKPLVFQNDPTRIELIMLRAPLVPLLLQHYPAAAIYQLEDSIEHVRPRIEARYLHSEESTGTRLSHFSEELKAGRLLADRIFTTTDTNQAIDAIIQAITQDFN